MSECVFCKIIAGELPSTIVTETENLVVIKDIAPRAAIHYLIMPRKHLTDLASLSTSDLKLAGEMLLMARDLSQKMTGIESFRLITNNGAAAGQTVPHLHFHFLAGSELPGF